MKYLALLLIFGFGLSGFGQTIKTLAYNTTNGHVVYTGTNPLWFTSNGTKFQNTTVNGTLTITDGNQIFTDGEIGMMGTFQFGTAIKFNDTNVASETRTNLGLGWSALTNTNAATSLLGFSTNGQVVASTAELKFTNETTFGYLRLNNSNGVIFIPDLDGAKDIFFFDTGPEGADAQRARTNLGLGATWLTNTNSPPFTVSVPVATNSTGIKGQMAISSNHLYICVDTNQWRRIQLGTW